MGPGCTPFSSIDLGHVPAIAGGLGHAPFFPTRPGWGWVMPLPPAGLGLAPFPPTHGAEPCPLHLLPPHQVTSHLLHMGQGEATFSPQLSSGLAAPAPLHIAKWCLLCWPRMLNQNHHQLAYCQTMHCPSSPLGKKVEHHWSKITDIILNPFMNIGVYKVPSEGWVFIYWPVYYKFNLK